ncbi:hypothetical protein Vadar_001595 [Vaccinium darrowii]|uniref:Uncharacterized protein n=1 Tax=Vaccinium darrowii TaxID=229202 RepID=A0ACB7XMC7_9ERIC|nr:hypothetical protein Vadar_001595 [Vaccinium darrowii]
MHLYKSPSDAELVKPKEGGGGPAWKYQYSPRLLVDNISCRQAVYRRSFTFPSKDLVPEQTNKCFHPVREIRVVTGGRRRRRRKVPVSRKRRWRCVVVVRRVKEFSCNALRAIFHKLLACAVSVDVVDHKGK